MLVSPALPHSLFYQLLYYACCKGPIISGDVSLYYVSMGYGGTSGFPFQIDIWYALYWRHADESDAGMDL
jgi:hypothetical protein